MKSEKVTFAGHAGDLLAVRLDLPNGPIRSAAILAHCFTCSKDIAAARRISGRLAALGIAVLRFDFTGLGHSGGEFPNTHFSSNVADLALAAAFMDSRGLAAQSLIGHSLGGAAVLKATPDLPGVRAVVSIGAPFDPGHVAHNFGGKLDESPTNGSAMVDLAGRSFKIRKDFLDDISAASLEQALPRLNAALLVLHAPRDATVGIDNAGRIFGAAKHPKSFVSLDGADHLLTREEDAEYVAEVIASWSRRYLNLAPEQVTTGAPEGVVRVSEAEASGFRQDIVVAGRHQMIADESVAMGGTDLGPSGFMGNPALFPFHTESDTADTVIIQINPVERKGVPRSSHDIQNRLNEITFNSSLLKELRSIDFVARLIEDGKLDPDHYRRANIHIIENQRALLPLGASSKMNAEWAFLTHLRDLGRETARDWLARHHADIGERSTVDLRAMFQGIGPQHQG